MSGFAPWLRAQPLLPLLFRVELSYLDRVSQDQIQTGSEVTQPEGKLCCCSIPHTEKRLVNGVELIRVTGGP